MSQHIVDPQRWRAGLRNLWNPITGERIPFLQLLFCKTSTCIQFARWSRVNDGNPAQMTAAKPTLHVPLQLFVQEQQEFQTGIDDLRYRRRASRLSGRPASAQASQHAPPSADTIYAMLVTYTKLLQHALQVGGSLGQSAIRGQS